MDIKWHCLDCGAENLDNYKLTTFPLCGECLNVFFWDDILTPDEMEKANTQSFSAGEE